MLQNHEKKLIVLTLIIATAFLLIGGAVIYPQYRGIQKINRQIFDLRAALETKYEKTKLLHRSQIGLALAKKMSEEARTVFLKKGEEINLITSLEKLAERFSISQSLILSSQFHEINENLNDLDLQITARGRFADLMEYLEALEKYDYLFAVNGLNLSTAGENSLILFLNGKIYVQN